ncbi:prolipoprotein diacylglyceryl transferase [Paenibacillus alginolyticus]|uniref:Phosphatidylglycerol--prolipoprotein diacylglyceryl transferase n=2 Tax=Paenibacillus alginolyticus TaxID=59839 RepID=A0ABT4GDG0_9BACL|nr:prolipoprotein diacylglyceryl transferase [Paenibacillus alginolyticus]MEC0142773.1 prolipoprotein diacylglyceryl transferase [Paenibacillus alginolyticus]
MRVILFYIGSYPVHSYGLIVAIAILLGISLGYYLAKGTSYQKHVLDVAFFLIIGAIVGARFWEVFFFQWGYYSQHLTHIFSIWEGGLSIQGGLAGGFVAGAIYTWRHKLNFWEMADILSPAIIFGQGVGRIACLLNGDAFGTPTNAGWGLVYPPGTMAYDTYGSQPLYPAEVWEGQWDFVVFGLLLMLKSRPRFRGFLFLSYNIFYSFGRFMLEFLRGDTPRFIFHWTAAQITSMTLIVVCLAAMAFLYYKNNKFQPRNHAETLS